MLNFLITILSRIFSAKWNLVLYVLTLRLIKAPFYSVLDMFILNIILKYFLFLFVGFLITYFWTKYIWDIFFKNSHLFNLLDRSIAYDLLAIVMYLVLPLIIISSPLCGGYLYVVSSTLAQEYATMPALDHSVALNNPELGVRLARIKHRFPNAWTPLAEKRKLEILANALSRNGDSKKVELAQVLYEHIAEDKKQAKALLEEAHRISVVKDTHDFRSFNSAPWWEQQFLSKPGVWFFKDWFFY